MKIKIIVILKVFAFSFAFLCLTFSCSKNHSTEDKTFETLDVAPESSLNKHTLPLWVPGNYPKVAVVFGHGYENSEAQEPVISELSRLFGLVDNGGLIMPLTFPKEYFANTRVRNAWLYEALQNNDVFAIVIIAAPEKTHFALATLQDKSYNAKVYSIFPQDDVLGQESGSELVLDYKNLGTPINDSEIYQPVNRTELPQTTFTEESQFAGDITKILIPLIRRIKSTNNRTIPEDSLALANFLQKALQNDFPNCIIEKYIDAQTGIQAQNHFVLGAYDE